MRHNNIQMVGRRVDRTLITTQRLLFENARLRASLARSEAHVAARDLLDREGDHRIKNSLQIVVAVVESQARRAADATLRISLQGAAARIQAIARVHDLMQLSVSQPVIDLGAAIEAVSKSLHAAASDPQLVGITVRTAQLRAPITLARPLLLAVNELILNALRHAFTQDNRGTVVVSLARIAGHVQITVHDDGRGLPEGYSEGRGYGMGLVKAMIAQIGGTLEIESSAAGSRFTLLAPIPVADVIPSHSVSPSHAPWLC
jgi:two-component system, sensor histidine kinase PdtaS